LIFFFRAGCSFRSIKEAIRAQISDIAKEEKTLIGELQTLLLQLDQEQADELEHGKREVEELAGK
jgi:rubrerythrin